MNKFFKTYKEYRWRQIVDAGKSYNMERYERIYLPDMYIEARRFEDPRYVSNSLPVIVVNLIDENPISINFLKKYLHYLNSYNIELLLINKGEVLVDALKPYFNKLEEFSINRIVADTRNVNLFKRIIENKNNLNVGKFINYLPLFLDDKLKIKVLDVIKQSGLLGTIKDVDILHKILNNDELKYIHNDLLNTLTDEEKEQIKMWF
jgi:hypothetical protein